MPNESLAEILRVSTGPEGGWSASLEDFFGASLGGDLLARAVLVASADCGARRLRALHATYLEPPPPGVALPLIVSSLTGSPERAVREVKVGGKEVAARVLLRFEAPLDGPTFQDIVLEGDLPQPEALPSTHEQARAEGWPEEYAGGPIEFRRIGQRWADATRRDGHAHLEWVKPRAPLPDDPRLQDAALAFICDFYAQWEFERRVGEHFDYAYFRPTDLALWIHAAKPWEDSPSPLRSHATVSHQGVALSRRELFTRKGLLLATVVREARIREV